MHTGPEASPINAGKTESENEPVENRQNSNVFVQQSSKTGASTKKPDLLKPDETPCILGEKK